MNIVFSFPIPVEPKNPIGNKNPDLFSIVYQGKIAAQGKWKNFRQNYWETQSQNSTGSQV